MTVSDIFQCLSRCSFTQYLFVKLVVPREQHCSALHYQNTSTDLHIIHEQGQFRITVFNIFLIENGLKTLKIEKLVNFVKS